MTNSWRRATASAGLAFLAALAVASPAAAAEIDDLTPDTLRRLAGADHRYVENRANTLLENALDIMLQNRQAVLSRDVSAVQEAIESAYEGTGGEAAGSTKGLTANTLAARNEIADRFGDVELIGGFRSSGSRDPSGHPSGRAIDVMIPGDYNSDYMIGLGDAIAQWAMDNHERLGVKYVIWRQRVWTPQRGHWRAMEDRGSDNQNHMNHVHISFLT
jgi:hypothetical protein